MIDELDKPLCQMCGADSPRRCELSEEFGGECPWELTADDEPETAISGQISDQTAKPECGE